MADAGVRRRATGGTRGEDGARGDDGGLGSIQKGKEGLRQDLSEALATSSKVPGDSDSGAGKDTGRERVPGGEGEKEGKGERGEGEGKGRKKDRKARPAPPLTAWEITSMVMTVFTAVVTVSSTYFIVQQWRTKPTPQTLWTAEKLSKYDGSDPKLPLLLGCLGEVFDVSAGHQHYGKGKSYNHFCGRDASRAFVSGNFTGDGLTDDVSKLTYDQLVSVAGWKDFYHKTYKHAGKLVGRFYDASGQPTKNLTRFERQLARAKQQKAKQEAEDKAFPGCNSYWSSAEGGKVYCDEGKGFPRQLFSVLQTGEGQSTQRTRCVCMSEQEIRSRADLKGYDGCDPWATMCQTSPPESS